MSEKIGVIIDFLTPAYEKTLRDTAARCGYDIVFFPSSKAAAGNVDDCTILYGHPSQKVIAGAKNLKWYASCWAGIDRFCRDELYQNPDCLLTNASGAYGTTIAEHSVMVSLMLLRRELEYTEVIREGDWRVCPAVSARSTARASPASVRATSARNLPAAYVRSTRQASSA